MAIVTRSQAATAGDIIQLRTTFRSPTTGEPIDLDIFPQISIQQPSGNILYQWSSLGVYHIATGIYGYDYSVDSIPELGVWNDEWRGQVGTNILYNSHNFIVYNTQLPATNSDGYVHLGDEPGFDYSQNALKNINRLVAMMKARLNSSGKVMVKNEYGAEELIDCDIFTIPQLAIFLESSLSIFNSIPHFTWFTFENTEFIQQFGEILVRYAVVSALASKALIEKGTEMSISDNGVTFQPPGVSDMLNSQYGTEYTHWESDVRLIKQNMKPAPFSLLGYRSFGANPQYMRQRHKKFGSLY